MIAYRKIGSLTREEVKHILVNIIEFGSEITKILISDTDNTMQIKISHNGSIPYEDIHGDIYIVLTNKSIQIDVIDDRPNDDGTNFKTYPYQLTPRKELLLFQFLFSLGMHEMFNSNPYLIGSNKRDLMYRFSKTRNNVYEFIVGLDIESAEVFLAELGFKTRIVRNNDEFSKPKKMFNAQYIDLHVVDGIVIMVERELEKQFIGL